MTTPQDRVFLFKTFSIVLLGLVLTGLVFIILFNIPDTVYLRFDNQSGENSTVQFVDENRRVVEKIEIPENTVIQVLREHSYAIKVETKQRKFYLLFFDFDHLLPKSHTETITIFQNTLEIEGSYFWELSSISSLNGQPVR